MTTNYDLSTSPPGGLRLLRRVNTALRRYEYAVGLLPARPDVEEWDGRWERLGEWYPETELDAAIVALRGEASRRGMIVEESIGHMLPVARTE